MPAARARAAWAAPGGTSAYLRLSTRPLDQRLGRVPGDAAGRAARRRDVLGGGYRLRPRDGAALGVVVMGALAPEALAAAEVLESEAGVGVEVVCVTSADLLFRALQARSGLGRGDPRALAAAFPVPSRSCCWPTATPHTLSFLGAVHAVPVASLGVQRFGQSGDLEELYEHHGIDTESVVGAALDLLEVDP